MWVQHKLVYQERFVQSVDPLADTGGYHWGLFVNLESILKNNLLSRNEVVRRQLRFADPSIATVQDRRSSTEALAGGPKLHDYANLLWHPRNKGLYRVIQENHESNVIVCEYRVEALELPGAIATSMWAPAVLPYRLPSEGFIPDVRERHRNYYESHFQGWNMMYWTNEEQDEFGSHSSNKWKSYFLQAEVLIPTQIPSGLISKIFVANEDAGQRVLALLNQLAITGWIPHPITIVVCPSLFFGKPRPGLAFGKFR